MINYIVDATEICSIDTVLKHAMPIWITWYIVNVANTTANRTQKVGVPESTGSFGCKVSQPIWILQELPVWAQI